MTNGRSSCSLALALMAMLVSTAATALTPEERLDEMFKRATGGTPPRTMDSGTPPTPDQTIAWYGLIGDARNGAIGTIKELEKEADRLVFGSGTANVLAEKMKALEGQAKSSAVTAAEGGIGGGNKGLGWYCTKLTELITALDQRVDGFDQNARQFRVELMAIPVGKDDSITQLTSLVERFNQGIREWQNHEQTQKINATVQEVATGLTG